MNGYLPQYLERIYKYYDIKTKESIGAMIAMVEPVLLDIGRFIFTYDRMRFYFAYLYKYESNGNRGV